jgi:hypothetical protein
MNEIILTERSNIVAIANAVRNKTGKNNNMNLGQIVDAINSIAQAVGIDLDAELNAQDAKIASQDALIANIVSALEGKAAGGGGIEIPELCTVTYESAWGRLLNIGYLTINESNTLTRVFISDSVRGTIQVVPYSYLDIWTSEVEEESLWGTETYCPSITDIQHTNSDYQGMYVNSIDNSMALVPIKGHATITVKTEG